MVTARRTEYGPALTGVVYGDERGPRRSSGLRQLRTEHLDGLDDRRRGQQVRRLRHQGLSDRAGEMGLPPGLVGEGVEDTERGGTEPQGEPHRGRPLLPRELEP